MISDAWHRRPHGGAQAGIALRRAEPGRCQRRRTARRHGRAPILIERPFVVTPKGTRLARPIDGCSRDFVRARWATAAALVVLAATGCGAETPDYHSVWSTSSATPNADANHHRCAGAARQVPSGRGRQRRAPRARQAHRPDGDDAAAEGLAAVHPIRTSRRARR